MPRLLFMGTKCALPNARCPWGSAGIPVSGNLCRGKLGRSLPGDSDSCLALLRTNCVKQGKSLKLSMTQFFSSGNGEGGNLGSFQVQTYDFEH